MTLLAQRLAWDYCGDLNVAKRMAERVARAYRMSDQSGDAYEYEHAAESLQNEIDRRHASALAGAGELGNL